MSNHDPFKGRSAVTTRPVVEMTDVLATAGSLDLPEIPAVQAAEPSDGGVTANSVAEAVTDDPGLSVPESAADVVAWIGAAGTSDTAIDRALAALDVENQRETQRITVIRSVREVLDGGD